MSVCTIERCDLPVNARGLCAAHYMRAKQRDALPQSSAERDAGPNPWAHRAPACPNGHPPADVYLFDSDLGVERWICVPCGRLFVQ